MLRGGVSQGGGLKVTADKKGIVGILPPDRTAVVCGCQMVEGGHPLSRRDPTMQNSESIVHALLSLRCPSLQELCFPTSFFPFQFLSVHLLGAAPISCPSPS